MIIKYPNGKEYNLIDCPFCGQNIQFFQQETARFTVRCGCGAEAHGIDLDEAIARWNSKQVSHLYFEMPEDELGRNKILIHTLKEELKQKDAFYEEKIRQREIALDNLRAGRPESADGGFSSYLQRQAFERRCQRYAQNKKSSFDFL